MHLVLPEDLRPAGRVALHAYRLVAHAGIPVVIAALDLHKKRFMVNAMNRGPVQGPWKSFRYKVKDWGKAYP
jgi:hypothetical protein